MNIKFNEIENKEWYTSLSRIRTLGIILLIISPFFVLLDLFFSFNNYVLFKIANIKSLKRSQYIKPLSRMKLKDKSLLFRIGCVYCAYVNGLAYFIKDIALSYEMLFCPWINKNNDKVEHYKVFKQW